MALSLCAILLINANFAHQSVPTARPFRIITPSLTRMMPFVNRVPTARASGDLMSASMLMPMMVTAIERLEGASEKDDEYD